MLVLCGADNKDEMMAADFAGFCLAFKKWGFDGDFLTCCDPEEVLAAKPGLQGKLKQGRMPVYFEDETIIYRQGQDRFFKLLSHKEIWPAARRWIEAKALNLRAFSVFLEQFTTTTKLLPLPSNIQGGI